ncbi:MAG TPA: 2-phospho-L-lactate guanylyltransferase [Dehalococcoidia bacterium]|nr:2-phospho-L-lactate guanylyltransferase [Dehalococcoidia bacterium]
MPAKALGEAKGRLADVLTTEERRQLALAMLEDVVSALTAAPSVESVSVVSPDNEVLSLAARLGADAIAESANVVGLNQALTRALSAMSPPPDALLVVPGDVPEMTPEDVEALLAALPPAGIVICPSPDEGTSALALRPANVITFRFGRKSLPAHVKEAEKAGLTVNVVRIASLSRDVDEPEQLRELLERAPDTATYRALREMGIEERV